MSQPKHFFPHLKGRVPEIAKATGALTALIPGIDWRVYGSRWPMHLAGLTPPTMSDIDIQIGWDDWCKLPKETKAQFELHPPHWGYLRGAWRARSGKAQYARYKSMLGEDGLPKGNIWVLRGSDALTEEVGVPVELVISRHLKPVDEMLAEPSVAWLQVVEAPEGVYMTDAAMRDLDRKTLTLCSIPDGRSIARNQDLACKHSERTGWPVELAPETWRWFGGSSWR